MASVTFDHVWKEFGEVTALKDLCLQVEDKEFLVLVGPSGCGKTTALLCLAGLEPVTRGQVLIADRVINDLEPKDRDIAMVFQSYALYPHMSVFDNMALGLKLHKAPKPEIRRRVEEAALSLGIETLLKRKPAELSGGQAQRVALGRAIVREPRVFLLDEPLSNLDARLRMQTRAEISKLHQRLQTTFIYVTHDQIEAMTMATRIAVINQGILQQLDTPQNLYDYPANQFVAGFIGSPAMNFFPGKLYQDANGLTMDTGDFSVRVPAGRAEPFRPYVNHPVLLGVRPEDIHNPVFTPPGIHAASLEARVEVIERMGHEIMLHLEKGDHRFVARVDPRTRFTIGEQVQLAINMDNCHLFDPGINAVNPPAIRQVN